MPVPTHPDPQIPIPVAPFDALSPVCFFTVARRAQHATTAEIARELGSQPRSVAKNISRAIHRLVAVGELPPGSLTYDIIALYLQLHAPGLFATSPDTSHDDPFEIRNEGVRAITEGLSRWTTYHRQVLRLPNLHAVDLNNMNLTGANLSYTNLAGVAFAQTNLTDAKFRHADLTDAKFRHANLTDADFTGAIATETNFGGAFGATKESLKRQLAMWSDKTIWPSYEKAGEGR